MNLFDILKWIGIGLAIYFGLGYFLPRPLTRALILAEYERVILFKLGELVGQKGPGLVLLWDPRTYVHSIVDLRMEASTIPQMNVITRDQVELTALGIQALHRVLPDQVIQWGVYTDADAQRAVRQAAPQALVRSVCASVDFVDLLAAAEQGRLSLPVEPLNREVEGRTGRHFDTVLVTNFDVPDTVADELAKAAQARIGATGIGFTRDAFITARSAGVDQQVLAWRDADVRERLAERAVQPIEIRGGGGVDVNTALLAKLVQGLLGQGGES